MSTVREKGDMLLFSRPRFLVSTVSHKKLHVPFFCARFRLKPGLQHGFTLIELVTVVLILGILVAVAAPRYAEALDGTYARAAAVRVESDLKYARQLARQTSSSQTVTFDVAASRYTLAGVVDRDRRSDSYVVTLADGEFNSAIVSADFNGTSSVTFDIHGHADNAGTVVVQSGGRTETVAVDAYGGVSIP